MQKLVPAAFKCSASIEGTTLHITKVPADFQDAAISIQFSMDEGGSFVIAEDSVKRVRITFTPTLNASGICKMTMGSRVFEVWQVSKMILEDFLFPEQVSDPGKPTTITGSGYSLG